MPNWCDNIVTLRHQDKSKLDGLRKELEKKDPKTNNSLGEFFNYLHPNPDGEWDYNWSCTNWGTKWEADIIDWDFQDDSIWISFSTAWSPPIPFYDYISNQDWQVEAIYHECGMCYGGVYNSADGTDECYEYQLSDPESIKDLPRDLIEFADLENKCQEYILETLATDYVDFKRTEMFPVDIKPVHEGYYEIKCFYSHDRDISNTYSTFCQFKDGNWDFWNVDLIVGWCGLVENLNEKEMG